jgi:hypothetical protein
VYEEDLADRGGEEKNLATQQFPHTSPSMRLVHNSSSLTGYEWDGN